MDKIRVRCRYTQFERIIKAIPRESFLFVWDSLHYRSRLPGSQRSHVTPPPSRGLHFSGEWDICTEFMLTNIPHINWCLSWLVGTSGLFFLFLLFLVLTCFISSFPITVTVNIYEHLLWTWHCSKVAKISLWTSPWWASEWSKVSGFEGGMDSKHLWTYILVLLLCQLEFQTQDCYVTRISSPRLKDTTESQYMFPPKCKVRLPCLCHQCWQTFIFINLMSKEK